MNYSKIFSLDTAVTDVHRCNSYGRVKRKYQLNKNREKRNSFMLDQKKMHQLFKDIFA